MFLLRSGRCHRDADRDFVKERPIDFVKHGKTVRVVHKGPGSELAGPNAKADLARLMAVLRYRVRSRIEVQVLDLTEGGCMVESRGWSVNPQERVMVKLPGLAEMAANVVWIEDHRAGLAFEDPLYGPVVENLVLQM